MKMFRKILVLLDGSTASRAGLAEAIALAKGQSAQLRLIHIVDENVIVQGMEPAMNIGDLLNSLATEGNKILEAGLRAAKKSGIRADTVLYEVLGRVSDRIVSEAEKWRADIIVMGTHGRRGIARLVMGSDAENVIRATPVPVLLVKAPKRRSR